MCSCGEKNRSVYLRYLDHVLFRNADPDVIKPVVREAMGWVVKDDDEAIMIVFDKSVDRLLHEKDSIASGLVVLKKDVLEMKRIG